MEFSVYQYTEEPQQVTRISGFHACNETDYELYYDTLNVNDWYSQIRNNKLCIDDPYSIYMANSPDVMLVISADYCSKKDCAPKAVIEELKQQEMTLYWWYPTKVYDPQQYGDKAVPNKLLRNSIQLLPNSQA